MSEMKQNCRICSREFVVNEWEQEHLKKMGGFPLPTLCIDDRHRRRFTHRNERKIYKDKCDLTGKEIISIYSPDKNIKVLAQDVWWSDKWDPLEYGRDFDFNRPFFEQFDELRKSVPHLSLLNSNGENSEYCNLTTDNKNSYLVFGGDFNQDALNSVFCFWSRDVSDLYWVNKAELSYDCIDCTNCYSVKYAQNTHNCRDSAFLFDCRSCENCIGCVGLRGKKFHIFNKQYSPEEYAVKLKEMRLDTWSGVEKNREEFKNFKLSVPVLYADILNCENCVGDKLKDAKNCENCFDVYGPAEDLKDIFLGGWNLKDAMSCSHIGHKSELEYEVIGVPGVTNGAFSSFIWYGSNVLYSDTVAYCNNVFGCSNMHHLNYCIFNKQYSKEEYESLKARIIEHMKKTGEWGEFLPMEYSYFAYNETVAQDFVPKTKDEILAEGLKWHDEEIREIKTQDIPDSIHDVKDDILQQTFTCEKTGRPYRIVPQELKLYRQMEVPIPHFAPETRNEMRIRARNPHHTWERNCEKCGKIIQTSYSPNRPEKVYCESCYLAEVY